MELNFEVVKRLLDEGEAGRRELLEIIEETHPADLADIVERLEEQERKSFFSILPAEIASQTLAETGEEHQEDLIKSLDDQTLQEMFEELPDDEATDIVQDLSAEEARRVMRVIDVEDRRDIQTLMQYGEDTAGGVMTTEFVSVDTGLTAREAIGEVRRQGREIQFFSVYVVDKGGFFRGTVSVTDLILADPGTRISEIVETDTVSVLPETDQEEVARILSRYNLVAVPVVEHDGRLIGRVTVDDVIDILEEEATEDLFRMSGVDEDESVERVGVFKSVRSRLPWLCLNLCFIFVSSKVIGLFLNVLEKEVVLAMFMPMVAGIGGNASTQSLAVTLRRLILEGSLSGKRRRVVISETLVGMLNGLIISLLIVLLAFLIQGSLFLAFIVGGAALVSMTLAGLLVAFIPIFLNTLGFDPAVSSTFISNITDIISFFLLLGLGALLLL